MNRPAAWPVVSEGGEVAASPFADDVRRYLALTPRQLPSRFLYDALGSALFDAICELPWYRITRAETGLLLQHGRQLWSAMAPLERIIELGAGDGRKLAAFLSTRPQAASRVRVDLVDISAAALESAARAASAIEGTEVVCHEATYEPGIERASGREARGRALVLFLGSNVGNFDPPGAHAFLRHVRQCLHPGDALLVGVDLVKPERELLLAYDDPLGVTAAFNLNVLVRINRELGGDFDLAGFAHRASWNAAESRVEMHLVSRRRQRVRIPASRLEIEFQEAETIWTESSYKYRSADAIRMIEGAGYEAAGLWKDEAARFALALCRPRPVAA